MAALQHYWGGRHAAHGYQVELEVMGANGWLRIGEHSEKNLVTIFNHEDIVRPAFQDFIKRFNHTFILELQDFTNNIIKGQQPSITVEDGLKVLKITKACQESVNTGKVIDIKL